MHWNIKIFTNRLNLEKLKKEKGTRGPESTQSQKKNHHLHHLHHQLIHLRLAALPWKKRGVDLLLLVRGRPLTPWSNRRCRRGWWSGEQRNGSNRTRSRFRRPRRCRDVIVSKIDIPRPSLHLPWQHFLPCRPISYFIIIKPIISSSFISFVAWWETL